MGTRCYRGRHGHLDGLSQARQRLEQAQMGVQNLQGIEITPSTPACLLLLSYHYGYELLLNLYLAGTFWPFIRPP